MAAGGLCPWSAVQLSIKGGKYRHRPPSAPSELGLGLLIVYGICQSYQIDEGAPIITKNKELPSTGNGNGLKTMTIAVTLDMRPYGPMRQRIEGD